MEVLEHPNGPFAENTWVLVDDGGDAIVIDPGFELESLIERIEFAEYRVDRIINTHGHLDHVYGVVEMQQRLGLGGTPVEFWMHPADRFLLEGLEQQCAMFGIRPSTAPKIDRELADGDRIKVGSLEIRVVLSPGHSPGGVLLIVENQNIAFVGDSLFQGSIGRTDLPGGDWPRYQKTLREVILALPDDLVCHTGHGSSTTIGVERRSNPFLLDLQ